MADNLSKRLQKIFNIGIFQKKDFSNNKEIIPTVTTASSNPDGSERTTRVKFPSDIEKLWKWWVSQTSDSSETLKNRMDRYKDLDYMVYNEPIMSMAVDLYADEASNCDVQSIPVGVTSRSPKVAKTITSLFEQWGVNQSYIRETAWNIALYGDSFDINILDGEKGIEVIEQQDIRTIKDRMEFKASEISKKLNSFQRATLERDPTFSKLISSLEDSKSDYAQFFRSYLLGYQLSNNLFLPPWAVNHFRFSSNRSEFWPFGRSLFINSIGPFRQLKSSKNLMALARASKFPKELFEIETSEEMTASEKWDAVNEAREEFLNLGIENKNKEDFSIGSQLWMPSNLLKYSLIENSMRLEDIADVELLRDDLIMGTRIPKGYLIVDRGAFGTSSQSLLQQFKPFGRSVYSIQSVILSQLSQMIKIHFLMTGEFDKEETEFELTMNFPVIEEASDRLRMKNDSLRLAADIISNIQTALGSRDGLPADVVEYVFSKFSFLDPEDVEDILNTIKKQTPAPGDSDSLSMMEKVRNRLNEEIIYDSIFESKKKFEYKEGVMNKKHFLNSSVTTPDQVYLFSSLRENINNGNISKKKDFKG